MGELLTFSQSSLLLLSRSQLCIQRQGRLAHGRSMASFAMSLPCCSLSMTIPTFSDQKQLSWKTRTGVVSDSKVPTTFTVDSGGEGIDVLPDAGGGSDDRNNGGGGGGGGGNGGNHNENEEGGDGNENEGKKQGMLMSQKVTLAFAGLVGFGGIMGYLKGGSVKSLVAGGGSALLLYFVFTLLPSNPVMASCIGLVLSASLLGVMGSRFKKSGKMFPAGIVSLASLVMSGGYLHGILRSVH